MKDWRFHYHDNRNALWVYRRAGGKVFHPNVMSDWLRAKGDPSECSAQWLPQQVRRPKR